MTLDNKIALLRDVLYRPCEDNFNEANEIINSIAILQKDDSLIPLLRLFDDSLSDSIMFSLLHAVESWDDSQFSIALLEILDELWAQAPRWTMIIHIRIMNNPRTFSEYSTNAIASATRLNTVRAIYGRISSDWPQLEHKAKQALRKLQT
jgi:hypothetical protein